MLGGCGEEGRSLEMPRGCGEGKGRVTEGGGLGNLTGRGMARNYGDLGRKRYCESMSAWELPVVARRRGATGLEFWRRGGAEELQGSQYQCFSEQVRQGYGGGCEMSYFVPLREM